MKLKTYEVVQMSTKMFIAW